jgi:putative ABC transport system substrate-binding protein
MDRRAFLMTMGAGIAAAPLIGEAQQVGKVWRIGFMINLPRPAPRMRDSHEAFFDELAQLGYREGHNIVTEWRHTEGLAERRRREGPSLLQWTPDVVVVSSGADALVLRETSKSVPIVVAAAGDLVGMGLAATLARPGGSVTGFQMLSSDLMGKRIELMKELVPKLDRLAVLHQGSILTGQPSTPGQSHVDRIFADVEASARVFAIKVLRFASPTADDFDRTFAEMRREGVQAALAVAGTLFSAHHDRLAEMTFRHRLPVMYEPRHLLRPVRSSHTA